MFGVRLNRHIGLALLIAALSLTGCKQEASKSAYERGVAEASSKWSAETVGIDEDNVDKLASNVAKSRKDYEEKLSNVDPADLTVAGGEKSEADGEKIVTYIYNISTGQFHSTSCELLKSTAQTSLKNSYGNRKTAVGDGYQPCTECKP